MLLRNKAFNIDKSSPTEKIKQEFAGVTNLGQLIDYVEENKSIKNKEEFVDFAAKRIEEELIKRQEEMYEINDLVKRTSTTKNVISIIISILFLIAGAYFLYKFVSFSPSVLGNIPINEVINGSNSEPLFQLIIHLFYLIIGFVLLIFGLNILRKNTLLRDFSGLSHIQHEILSGLGESRPLIQVIQETLINAKATFTQSLVISKAMFWTGLVFIIVALFQILVLGRVAYANVQVDPGVQVDSGNSGLVSGLATSGFGILTWIVSTFLSQRKKMLENLENITQLEFVLVGFSKQISLIDLYISGDVKETEFTKSSKQISEKMRDSLALIELYTKVPKDKNKADKSISDEYKDLISNEIRSSLSLKDK